jgi:hypothetical protein
MTDEEITNNGARTCIQTSTVITNFNNGAAITFGPLSSTELQGTPESPDTPSGNTTWNDPGTLRSVKLDSVDPPHTETQYGTFDPAQPRGVPPAPAPLVQSVAIDSNPRSVSSAAAPLGDTNKSITFTQLHNPTPTQSECCGCIIQ